MAKKEIKPDIFDWTDGESEILYNAAIEIAGAGMDYQMTGVLLARLLLALPDGEQELS